MTSALDDLRAARALVVDPAHWTTGVYARDADGRVTFPESETAVCWCAWGALLRPTGNKVGAVCGREFLIAAARELFGCEVAIVNDHHGHTAVLRTYDRAIERAGAS